MTTNQRYYLSHKVESHRRAQDWKKRNPEYMIWIDMRRRCNNPKRADYKRWGGRGIQVVYKSYGEFIRDVGPRPSAQHTIDRINNDGHYEKKNCRWATYKEQRANRRDSGKVAI